MAKNIKCPYCKKLILDTTKFCPECGKKLTIVDDNKSSIPSKPVQKTKFNMTEVFNDDDEDEDDDDMLEEEDEDMDDFDDEEADDEGFDEEDSEDEDDEEDGDFDDEEDDEDDSDDDDEDDFDDDDDEDDYDDDDEEDDSDSEDSDDDDEEYEDDDEDYEEYDDDEDDDDELEEGDGEDDFDEDDEENDDEDEEYEDDEDDDFDEEPAPKKQPAPRKNINAKSIKGTSAILLSEAKSKHDTKLPQNNSELNKARQARASKDVIEKKKEAIKKQPAPTSRQQADYSVNHDHYYDDVLPEMIDDVSKFPFEVLIKAGGAIVFLIGAIAYCIYYVNI